MALPHILSKIIEWLRRLSRGSATSIHPLFALLGSELTDSEVSAIAEELANESKQSPRRRSGTPSPR